MSESLRLVAVTKLAYELLHKLRFEGTVSERELGPGLRWGIAELCGLKLARRTGDELSLTMLGHHFAIEDNARDMGA